MSATGKSRLLYEARYLIAGQEAFAYSLPDESQRTGPDVHQFADQTFDTLTFFDVANMHPLSNMIYRGRHYDLGQFMCGRLCLRNLRQYCLDLYQEPKPLNLDEDNAASQYKDPTGWTIHRKRAWTTLLCRACRWYVQAGATSRGTYGAASCRLLPSVESRANAPANDPCEHEENDRPKGRSYVDMVAWAEFEPATFGL